MRHHTVNPTVRRGDPNLHWVQPATFFYWMCYSPDAVFPPGVLAYPFQCGGYHLPAEQQNVHFKFFPGPNPPPGPTATPQPTATHLPTPTLQPHPPNTASPGPSSAPSPTPRPTATRFSPATATPTPDHNGPSSSSYNIFAPGGLRDACVSDPAPHFSSHITDLGLISYLTPAGTVQAGDLKPHGFLHNVRTEQEVPVYAPVDSYLIDFAYYRGYTGESHYTFKFQVSCEVAYYFDHLRAVVDRIDAVVPDAPAEGTHGTTVQPPLFFRAGDLIGYTGGSPAYYNWDFGVLNTGRWNPLPQDVTYNLSGNVEKYRFAVCPYEYFDEAMRGQYLALLDGQPCGP